MSKITSEIFKILNFTDCHGISKLNILLIGSLKPLTFRKYITLLHLLWDMPHLTVHLLKFSSVRIMRSHHRLRRIRVILPPPTTPTAEVQNSSDS